MSTKNTKSTPQQSTASADVAVKAEASSTARRGPVRRNRRTSEQEKQTNGRTHEENQERAYIAASRRSDRSIEARLESARRASEIHKRRCGRGLKVTEEAVMNEEMYEEEDPDYEQRVSRLRMVMNTPNYPYAAFSPMQPFYPLMMHNSSGNTDSTQNSTPGTPAVPNTTMEQQHPQHQYLFSPWFNQTSNGMPAPQSPILSVTPGGNGQMSYDQMSHSMGNFQPQQVSPTQQQSPHFLPPTQFPQRTEAATATKPAYAAQQLTQDEVLYDQTNSDLFADVDLDAVNPNDGMWNFSNTESHEQQTWMN